VDKRADIFPFGLNLLGGLMLQAESVLSRVRFNVLFTTHSFLRVCVARRSEACGTETVSP